MRAVIDTNVIIAAMRSTLGASHAILHAIYTRKFVPVLSVPLAMEYDEVAKRPGLVPHLSTSQIDSILNQICARSVEQRIYFHWRPLLPDPDDDIARGTCDRSPGAIHCHQQYSGCFACPESRNTGCRATRIHPLSTGTMSSLTIKIPEYLRQQVERLTAEEGFSVDQFFAIAASEKIAVLEAVNYIGQRAALADDAAFEDAIAHIPAAPITEPWDEMPNNKGESGRRGDLTPAPHTTGHTGP